MPGRGRARRKSHTTTEPSMDSKAHSVNPDAKREKEEVLYDRVAQRLIDRLSREPEKSTE